MQALAEEVLRLRRAPLPIDLTVKLGVAQIYSNKQTEAEVCVSVCLLVLNYFCYVGALLSIGYLTSSFYISDSLSVRFVFCLSVQ